MDVLEFGTHRNYLLGVMDILVFVHKQIGCFKNYLVDAGSGNVGKSIILLFSIPIDRSRRSGRFSTRNGVISSVLTRHL